MKSNIQSEEIIDRLSGNYKYHIVLAVLCLLIGTCNDFVFNYLSFMKSPPYVSYLDSDGNEKIVVINYLFVLKNKHKLRCIEGKLDNHLESTVIIGFTNFPIYILVTCTFLWALSIYWAGSMNKARTYNMSIQFSRFKI